MSSIPTLLLVLACALSAVALLLLARQLSPFWRELVRRFGFQALLPHQQVRLAQAACLDERTVAVAAHRACDHFWQLRGTRGNFHITTRLESSGDCLVSFSNGRRYRVSGTGAGVVSVRSVFSWPTQGRFSYEVGLGSAIGSEWLVAIAGEAAA